MLPSLAHYECTASAGFDWLAPPAAPAELAGLVEPAVPIEPSLEQRYFLVQNEVETSMVDPIPIVGGTCQGRSV